MKPGHALAEDLRRFGIILIAAGVVSGFLQDRVSAVAAVYAAGVGVAMSIVGYWIHHREERREEKS